MKLLELLGDRLLESTITGNVTTPKQLKAQIGEVDVTGFVNLANKKLTRLPVKFGKVDGYFDCGNNQLTSLEGAPHAVGGNFFCNSNLVTSLEGTPHTVGGGFSCASNQLTSLEGVHKIIKKINGMMNLRGNPIESGGIGLIMIDGLTKIISDLPAFRIIEKYLGQGKKGLLLCQDELIEAGYEEYAKL